MTGRRMSCDLDGMKHPEVDDETFRDAGRIGPWARAEARSYFDDPQVTGE